MGKSKKTEMDVNEDLWIVLEGIIHPVNRLAQSNGFDPITKPAPLGRITEKVVRDVKQDVERIATNANPGTAREFRQYITDLDDLLDEVKQFNTDTKTYMANVNYDGGVEEL